MMENKHESEINAVRDLIELLDFTGVVFTFDALHCQKADATPRGADWSPPPNAGAFRRSSIWRKGTRTKQNLISDRFFRQ